MLYMRKWAGEKQNVLLQMHWLILPIRWQAFSMDACLYLNQNFGFICFPAELTTGSSIMPHKKNPDVFELIRAHCNRIKALPNEIMMMSTNLPSGYHRDLQLLKEHFFPAFKH